jgi:uncharacterized repeat protein (TIGR01451 family)
MRLRNIAPALIMALLGSMIPVTVAFAGAPSSDLAVTKTADLEAGVVGQPITYTVAVTNDGPDIAANVLVRDILDVDLELVSITASGLGSCTLVVPLECSFATLAVGGSETVTVVAVPLEPSPVSNRAVVESDSVDGDLSDNSARVRLPVAPAACTIVGTDGNDRLSGTSSNDVICGLGGRDALIGRGGRDRLLSGKGKDLARGGPGSDRVRGAGGRDRLLGARGRDRLLAGPGADRLRGGPGRDLLNGQAGRDVCLATRGDRTVSC